MKGPKWFDLDHDGEISPMEQMLGQSMMFSMIEEEEQRGRLTSAGIDPDDLDDFEKYQILKDARLDPSDFGL